MNNLPLEIGQFLDRARIVTLMLVLLSIAGCMPEEDEDHHLEHLIPAHKPANFSECVEQLDIRGEKLFSGKLNETERTELHDIVNWLPELAADSDLKRKQWEQVQSITAELEKIVQGSPGPEAGKLWEQHVAELKKLIPFTDRFKEESNTPGISPVKSDEEKSNG